MLGVIGFVLGAAVGNASAGQEPRTVTVTSIVTSLVTVPPTAIEPPTTETTRVTITTRRPKPTSPSTTRRRVTTTTEAPTGNCDSAYPDFCIPPPRRISTAPTSA